MQRMILWVFVVAAVPVLVACQPPPSSGATLPSGAKSAAAASAATQPGQVAPAAPAGDRAAELSGAPASAVRIAELEARLAKLEADNARNAEALEFLRKVYEQQKAQQQGQEREEPAPDAMFAVNIADSVKAGQVEGPASAPITIVKAFDFACPYCYRSVSTLDELRKDYRGQIRVVYMTMLVHPPAKPAHLASCAAAKQGKYNEFKRAFWDKGFGPYSASGGRDASLLGEDHILAIAKGLGLDVIKLKADMASPACESRITADMAELAKFHVNATPTFFINGKHVGGAQPKEVFAQIIDEQLKIVAASGVPGSAYYQKVVFGKGEKQFRSKLDPKPD